MTITHQAHILRPRLEEWCGGTEPPTIVTVHSKIGEVAVAVLEAGTNPHGGQVHVPVKIEQFLLPEAADVGPVQAQYYGDRAIQDLE